MFFIRTRDRLRLFALVSGPLCVLGCNSAAIDPLGSGDAGGASTDAGGAGGASTDAGGASSGGGAGEAPSYCETIACGTPCPCALGQPECFCDGDGQTGESCSCDAAGRCVLAANVTCSPYDPCADKDCGDACSPCKPGEPGCSPVGQHFCNEDLFCKTTQEQCP